METLRVGQLLKPFALYGGEDHHGSRVEAIGADWVVARDAKDGRVFFYHGAPEELLGDATDKIEE